MYNYYMNVYSRRLVVCHCVADLTMMMVQYYDLLLLSLPAYQHRRAIYLQYLLIQQMDEKLIHHYDASCVNIKVTFEGER